MDEHSTQDATTLRHESIETDVRAVWRTGVALAGIVIGSFVLVVGLMTWFSETEHAPPAQEFGKPEQSESGLKQTAQLQQLRLQEQQLLGNYEWIDRANGIARIPIEQAKQIVADKGLPIALSGPATPTSSPQQGAESVNSSTPAEDNQP